MPNILSECDIKIYPFSKCFIQDLFIQSLKEESNLQGAHIIGKQTRHTNVR